MRAFDRLLQAFGQKGLLEVGGKAEFRIRKVKEVGGGPAFADYVWKPCVLIEMKKRGTDLTRTYRQAFDYWSRLVPGPPNYVVLSNFDEFWVYDFDIQLDEPLDRVRIAKQLEPKDSDIPSICQTHIAWFHIGNTLHFPYGLCTSLHHITRGGTISSLS